MKRQTLIMVVLFLLLMGVVSGFAQQTNSPLPPPHHMGFHPPPPASVCTDGKHLYVIMGPKILQYTTPDLTLKKTLELPRPTPPENK